MSPVLAEADLRPGEGFAAGPLLWDSSVVAYLRNYPSGAAVPRLYVTVTYADGSFESLVVDGFSALPAPTIATPNVETPLRLSFSVSATTPEETTGMEYRVADTVAGLETADVAFAPISQDEGQSSGFVEVLLPDTARKDEQFVQVRLVTDYLMPASFGSGRREGPWSGVYSTFTKSITSNDLALQAVDSNIIYAGSVNEIALATTLTVGTVTGVSTLSTPDTVSVNIGKLASSVTDTATTIYVTETAVPLATPFNVVIDAELMTVTARVVGTPATYTVTRSVSSTTAVAHSADTIVYLQRGQGSVKLFSNGLLYTASDGAVGLSLPATGDALFRGTVLGKTVVSDDMKIRNTARIDADSEMVLSGGAIGAPYTGPSIGAGFPETYQFGPTLWNMNVTQQGSATGNKKTAWVANPYSANQAIEIDMTGFTGGTPDALLDTVLFDTVGIRQIDVGGECHSAVKVGNYVFVLWYAGGSTISSTMTISAYRSDNLAKVRDTLVTVRGYEPGLFYDHVSGALCLVDVDTYTGGKSALTTGLRLRSWQVSGTGNSLSLTLRGDATTANPDLTATGAGLSVTANSPLNVSVGGTVKDTSSVYFYVSDYRLESVVKATPTRTGTYITALSSSTASDALFTMPWGTAPWGLSWDTAKSRFWVMRDNGLVYLSAAETAQRDLYWSQAFVDGTTPTPLVTALSPTTFGSAPPYAVFIIRPNTELPISAAGWAYYGATDGFTFRRQALLYVNTIVSSDAAIAVNAYNSSGALWMGSTFPGGASSYITSESIAPGYSGAWSLNGDGTTSNLLSYSAGHYVSNDVTLATTLSDVTELNLTGLAAGTWLVGAVLTFENTNSGNTNRQAEAKFLDPDGFWVVSSQTRVAASDYATMSLTGVVQIASDNSTLTLRARGNGTGVLLKATTTSASGAGATLRASTSYAVRIA